MHFKEPNGNKLAFEADADQALLVGILPDFIRDYLIASDRLGALSEVVMDLGGFPEIRWSGELERLTQYGVVTQEHIDSFVSKLGAFNSDNRAGIERTLHRISAIRSRDGRILGVTCRIGRAIVGTISHLSDFIHSGKNILFLGPPGVGKTTQLRETARVLSTEFQKRVVIVDTSNEIGGDGDIPHPGIGFSRRMQVASPELQHHVMIEAVENHTPEVIVVDEIGTSYEASAARTIAERGVQLIATAHGYTLENLIKNPLLSDLVGGIQSVILGDEEAKIRGTQKTVLERKNAPTFNVIIELREKDLAAIYKDTGAAVDLILKGERVVPDLRRRSGSTVESSPPESNLAIQDATEVIARVLSENKVFECEPALDSVRSVQHKMATEAGLNSVDVGKSDYRRVRVFPAL